MCFIVSGWQVVSALLEKYQQLVIFVHLTNHHQIVIGRECFNFGYDTRVHFLDVCNDEGVGLDDPSLE